mmetsp:Transcript_26690/g.91864  ORF Transcript_26690/g.91864 Transcript_26690/m.91864 type:complete len:144 (-) Transcript_26690:29-460(-)
MAAAVVGAKGFEAASRARWSIETVACVACGVAAAAMGCLRLGFAGAGATATLVPLLIFQGCVGCAMPAFGTLRGRHVPAAARAAAAHVATAVSGIAAVALLPLYAQRPGKFFAANASLCAAAAVAMATLLRRAPPVVPGVPQV